MEAAETKTSDAPKDRQVAEELLPFGETLRRFQTTLGVDHLRTPPQVYVGLPPFRHSQWYICRESSCEGAVFDLFRPYRLRSKLLWATLRLVAKSPVLRLVPGTAIQAFPGLSLSAEVLHQLGNVETHQQEIALCHSRRDSREKVLVFYFDKRQRRLLAVGKLGISQKSRADCRNEMLLLAQLKGRELPFRIPEILCQDELGIASLRRASEGERSGLLYTDQHEQLLLSLKTHVELELSQVLQQLKGELLDIAPAFSPVIIGCLEKLPQMRLPTFLIHGDFAPWNLLISTEGKLTPIDWERGNLQGIPLFDYLFFFAHQHILLGNYPELFEDEAKRRDFLKADQVRRLTHAIGLDPSVAPAVLLTALAMIGLERLKELESTSQSERDPYLQKLRKLFLDFSAIYLPSGAE